MTQPAGHDRRSTRTKTGTGGRRGTADACAARMRRPIAVVAVLSVMSACSTPVGQQTPMTSSTPAGTLLTAPPVPSPLDTSKFEQDPRVAPRQAAQVANLASRDNRSGYIEVAPDDEVFTVNVSLRSSSSSYGDPCAITLKATKAAVSMLKAGIRPASQKRAATSE